MNLLSDSTGSISADLFTAPTATGGLPNIPAGVRSMVATGFLALAAVSQTTGASALAPVSPEAEATSISAPWVRARANALAQVPANPVRAAEVEELLVLLRRRFSLTLQQLAEIVGVTRPVLYRWQEGAAVPRSRNQERVARLVALAQHFESEGGAAVGIALHAPESGKASLFQLLSRSKLPEREIRESLSSLAAKQRRLARPRSLSEALDRLGVTGGDPGVVDREDARLSATDPGTDE